MKASFSTLLVLLIALNIVAQNNESGQTQKSAITNKKGMVIPSEKGDFAIGIDANPFFDYLGNFLKISDVPNYAPSFGFTAQQPGMIYGKYMISDNEAYFAALRVGFSSTTLKDGAGTSDSDIDKTISTAATIGLEAGVEKSRNVRSRIKGFYGYKAFVGKTPYIGTSFANPGLPIMGKIAFKDGLEESNNYIEKGGSTIGVGVGGLVGVEYFIFPKLSISGQFNLMLEYQYQIKREYIPETGNDVIVDSGMNKINLDNLASGNLALLFYF